MATRTFHLRQGNDRIKIEARSHLEALAAAFELTGKDRWTTDSEAIELDRETGATILRVENLPYWARIETAAEYRSRGASS